MVRYRKRRWVVKLVQSFVYMIGLYLALTYAPSLLILYGIIAIIVWGGEYLEAKRNKAEKFPRARRHCVMLRRWHKRNHRK
jgi:hypothetical protein